jgi:tRNA dimethylallyltransferase
VKPKVLVIAGPTASGKTKISIELAKRLNGEIISADSMQIYKDMNIGTAKPTEEEKSNIPHYMLDFLEVGEKFSVAQYKEMAMKYIEDILSRGKTPIIVGGTGLYINSIVEEINYEKQIEENKEIRKELEEEAREHGNERLYEELKKVDPEAATRIHLNDTKRIVRALEVFRLTGTNITEYQKLSKQNDKKYDYKIVGLYIDREKLYSRINERVELMIKLGLEDEAKKVIELVKDKGRLTSFQAIGYKEFLPYFEGKTSLQETIDNIKQESRRYAKRQITWFKRTEGLTWIDMSCDFEENVKKIINYFEGVM